MTDVTPGAPELPVEQRVRLHLARGEAAQAATEAIRAYGPGILGFLTAVLGEDDGRDAFSIFAEDLWRGISGFQGRSSMQTWAYRIAWHAASRYRRDPYLRRRRRLFTSAASRLAASVAPTSELAPGGRHDRVEALRDALDPDERTLLVLRIDRELGWEEIAAVLSAERGAVSAVALRKRFERLKRKLARLARAQGLLD